MVCAVSCLVSSALFVCTSNVYFALYCVLCLVSCVHVPCVAYENGAVATRVLELPLVLKGEPASHYRARQQQRGLRIGW